MTVIISNMWLKRNKRIFSNKTYYMDHYLFCITNDMFSWMMVFRLWSDSHDISFGHNIIVLARSLLILGVDLGEAVHAVQEEEE